MLHALLSGRARVATHVVGWFMVALLFYSLISGLRGPVEGLYRTALNMVFLLALFYGNAKIVVNRYFETGRYGRLIVITLALWLGSAALRTWTELSLFGGSIFQNNKIPPDGGKRMFIAYALSFFLLLLFSTLYQLLENRHTLELRHRDLEIRHTEAQLNYLKAQINPHFLFNSLNNIYAAATLQHPRTADMVLRLSDLLRYVTYDGQAAQVPLEKEIAQIHAYLDLFQLKSEHPLNIRFQVENAAAGRLIEPVLLLPLVENALKHGDLDTRPDAFLNITLQNDADRLLFRIENSFDPENRQKDEAGGVGLGNVRRRLELNYGKRHRFEAGAREGIFVVDLLIC